MGRNKIINVMIQQGLVPLFYHDDAAVSADVVRALYRAGIRTVEYTNRGPQASTNMRLLRKVCDAEMPGMYLGIGTIKDTDAAREFIDAGVDFLISPGLDEEVAHVAQERRILWIPGCMTTTEIMQAEKRKVSLVKLFPGNVLGPQFLRAIKPIFPDLSFMPTGGVTPEQENLEEWFDAGVSCVGLGSNLISKDILQQKDYHTLEVNAGCVLQLIGNISART